MLFGGCETLAVSRESQCICTEPLLIARLIFSNTLTYGVKLNEIKCRELPVYVSGLSQGVSGLPNVLGCGTVSCSGPLKQRLANEIHHRHHYCKYSVCIPYSTVANDILGPLAITYQFILYPVHTT